jgi:hypothetical protein
MGLVSAEDFTVDRVEVLGAMLERKDGFLVGIEHDHGDHYSSASEGE